MQDTMAAAQHIDFSLVALFLRASFTVKIVMLLLIGASFWSRAIIIQKHLDPAPDEGRGAGIRRGLLVGRAARRGLRPDRA